MNDFEKYMVEYRDKMNTEEPDHEHFDRFRRKLKKADPKIRRINFRHTIQIAASIAIILASGVVIIKSSKGGSKIADSQAVEEYQKAKIYYTNQVNERFEDISKLEFDSKKEKEVLLNELNEMDTYYKDLLKEFKANPGDERVIRALIQHYQIKLRVMDQIIEQLKEVNTHSNNEKNEESKI